MTRKHFRILALRATVQRLLPRLAGFSFTAGATFLTFRYAPESAWDWLLSGAAVCFTLTLVVGAWHFMKNLYIDEYAMLEAAQIAQDRIKRLRARQAREGKPSAFEVLNGYPPHA